MKLSVIGGGGVRSPFLAKSLVSNAKSIQVDQIVFMDINQQKLDLFGKISQEISNQIDPEIQFTTTTDVVEAVTGADFIITTIRGGGDDSRVYDEKIALKYHILGQETTGAAGFAMALRSVPILIDLCEQIVKYANKNVQVFNFTNPSGMVTQALRDAGYDFVYGICDAPSGFEKQLVKILEVPEESFEMDCFGLNHLSWYRNFKVNQRDVYDELMAKPNILSGTELKYFDREVVDLVGYRDLPNEYLYFYYYRDRAVDSIINGDKTRGETIRDINNRMIEQLSQLDMDTQVEEGFRIFIEHYIERENQYFAIESGTKRPKITYIPTLQEFIEEKDEGGYAGVAIKFIQSFISDRPVRMVLSVPNQGAIDFLEPDDVVEITCQIQNGVAKPIRIDQIDGLQKNLILTIKYFERNAVKAIAKKNKDLAVKALMMHPQINSYPIAKQILDEYLEEYKDYVGEWE